LILVGIFACSTVHGQTAKMRVDKSTVTLDDRLTLTISLSGNFESIKGPDLQDFDVLSKSSGTSISIIGGHIQQEQTITLVLAPKRQGRLKIGEVSLLSGGRVVASAGPIFVNCVGGGGRVPVMPAPQPEEKEEEQEQEEPPPVPKAKKGLETIFVSVRYPERTLYVGEPVFVEYVLYVRSGIPATGYWPEEMPAFKGYVTDQLPVRSGQGKEVFISGVRYVAYTLWRGLVTALNEGAFPLDEMKVVVKIGDFFRERSVLVKSEPVTLSFKRPPLENRPADYVEGTVGSFVIQSSLDKDKIKVNESAVLTVKVEGSGNLRGIRPKDIEIPNGLRINPIPGADLDEVVADVAGMSGKRVFQYLITGEKPGDYLIPKISLAFFNPITERYERTTTKPLALSVLSEGFSPQMEAKNERNIVDIVRKPVVERVEIRQTKGENHNRVLVAAVSLALVFYAGCEASLRLRGIRLRKGERPLSGAKKELLALESKGLSLPDFCGAIERIIRAYLSERFSMPAFALGYEELRDKLLEKGVKTEDVQSLLWELEACAFAKFAPTSSQKGDMNKAVQRVLALLERIDETAA